MATPTDVAGQLTGDLAEPQGRDDDVDLNLSSVSDTSLASNDNEEEETGPKTPPTEPSEPSLVNISDVSSDLDNEPPLSGELGETPTNQPMGVGEKSQELPAGGINQPESGEEALDDRPLVAKETGNDDEAPPPTGGVEEATKSADSAELSSVDTRATEEMLAEDVPHPHLAEVVSQQESAPPSPTAVGTPTKTPGKRKVTSLLDYTLHNENGRSN